MVGLVMLLEVMVAVAGGRALSRAGTTRFVMNHVRSVTYASGSTAAQLSIREMIMTLRSTLAIAGLALATIATPAAAGTLIIAGDATIAARFATGVANGNPALQGNIAFQQNILGGGNTVSAYLYSVVTTFPNPPLGQQVATAYTALGYTASTFTTPVNAAAVAGADLLVVLGRSNAFTSDETEVIRGFLYGGGNVLLTGESANIGATANTHINTLAAALGSDIVLNQVTQGIGDQFATGAEIVADPLTAGVTSFGYGRTTTLSGGRTLFFDDFGGAFVAADEITAPVPVPEPASWAMMIGGFAVVGGAMRRRSASMRFA